MKHAILVLALLLSTVQAAEIVVPPPTLLEITASFPSKPTTCDITLAWDANTEPDLSGYKIHFGKASGDYTEIVDMRNDVARTTTCPEPYDPFKVGCCEVTLTGFTNRETYYFAATAYDEDSNESAYSEELVHTFGCGPNPPFGVSTKEKKGV